MSMLHQYFAMRMVVHYYSNHSSHPAILKMGIIFMEKILTNTTSSIMVECKKI